MNTVVTVNEYELIFVCKIEVKVQQVSFNAMPLPEVASQRDWPPSVDLRSVLRTVLIC